MNDLPLTTRFATRDDHQYALELHHKAYFDVVKKQFGVFDVEQQDFFFEKAWKSNKHEILLLAGKVCGYLSVKRGPKSFKLLEIVIDPKCQNKGIGTSYIEQLQREVSEKGVSLTLEVLHKNKAKALYERLGFVEYGRSDTHLQMKWAHE